jgi:hypothetical protein
VICDIEIIKGHEKLIFSIKGFDDDQVREIGAYNTMAFGKSERDILPNIETVKPLDIVQMTFRGSFVSHLDSLNQLSLHLPYKEFIANRTPSLQIATENRGVAAFATADGLRSTFAKGILTLGNHTTKTQPGTMFATTEAQLSTELALTAGTEQFIALSIIRDICRSATVMTEAIFLADCSGSMEGLKIEHAKGTILRLVCALPGDCFCKVITFGSSHDALWPKAVKRSMRDSKEFPSKLNNSVRPGGVTKLPSPLQAVYSRAPKKDFVCQILALTDGQFRGEAEIFTLVAQRILRLRIGATSHIHSRERSQLG